MVQQILDGLAGDGPQLFQDLVLNTVEQVVHPDDAVAGDAPGDVARADALGYTDDNIFEL
jgi:hypothetical protein